MPCYFKHIRYHLPETRLTNDELQRLYPDWNIDELYGITGVRTRYIAAPGETPSDLAVKAAEKLFADHPELKEKVDFVLFCTQSNDYVTPTTACVIQNRLGIPTTAGALDFNQGCTGFVYGLALADGLLCSGTARNVLLLTAETISRYIHPRDKSSRFLFGDGAAATFVSSESNDGVFKAGPFVTGTDGSGWENIIIRYGCARHALADADDKEFCDEFGNVRTAKSFYMNGNAVLLFSLRTVPRMINSLLEKCRLDAEEIDYFCFHQASKIILDSLGKKMKIPAEKIIYSMEKCGNIVSSSIPHALYESGKKSRFRKGNKIVLAAFGVGMSWSATLLEMK